MQLICVTVRIKHGKCREKRNRTNLNIYHKQNPVKPISSRRVNKHEYKTGTPLRAFPQEHKNENVNNTSAGVVRTRNEKKNENKETINVHNSEALAWERPARYADEVNNERFKGKDYEKIMHSVEKEGIYGYDESEKENYVFDSNFKLTQQDTKDLDELNQLIFYPTPKISRQTMKKTTTSFQCAL